MSDLTHTIAEVEDILAPFFQQIEDIALLNQEKVLAAFHHVKATESDLLGTTGYGYDDIGRQHLEEIYAHTFRAQSAGASANYFRYTCDYNSASKYVKAWR